MRAIPETRYRERQLAFRKKLKKDGLSAYVTTFLPDIRYLTGFSGTAALVAVTPNRTCFFTDFRYQGQAAAEVTADRTVIITKNYRHHLAQLRLIRKGTRIGFNGAETKHAELAALKKSFPGTTFKALQAPLTAQRNIKDADEIRLLARAERITEQAYLDTLPFIKPGVRETEIAAELEYRMKLNGSTEPSFTTIVASGPRSALPHGVASDRKIRNHELVTMDFGATYKGYCGDFTRTVAVGTVSRKLQDIYRVVLEAQLASLDAVKPGITGAALDQIARDIIKQSGYGDYFGHGLGHGVGLEIHEDIRVSPGGKAKLVPGMVHSVEPGIYLPGKGGVRIEDVVAVTARGCRNLARTPKELLVL